MAKFACCTRPPGPRPSRLIRYAEASHPGTVTPSIWIGGSHILTTDLTPGHAPAARREFMRCRL